MQSIDEEVRSLSRELRSLREEVATLRAAQQRGEHAAAAPARSTTVTLGGLGLAIGGRISRNHGGGANPFGPGLRLSFLHESEGGHSFGLAGTFHTREDGLGAMSLLASGGYRFRGEYLSLRPHLLFGAIHLPDPESTPSTSGDPGQMVDDPGDSGLQVALGLGVDLALHLGRHRVHVGAQLLPVRPGYFTLGAGALFAM